MNTKLSQFINTNPKVKSLAERLARKSTATKQVFTSNLFVYWQSSLSKSFKSLGDWEAKVSEQAHDTENDIRTTWARDLEEYVLSRVASKTKRPMSKPARAVSFAAIKSYLTFRLGDMLPKYKPIFTVSSEDIAHAMEKGHDTTTVLSKKQDAWYSKPRRNETELSFYPPCGAGESVSSLSSRSTGTTTSTRSGLAVSPSK